METKIRPRISVIVPVYNIEKYLHFCIDSILSQTYTNFELILVNDGSTDKSGEICEEYTRKDGRIKVIHKKNEGVSIARNVGIDNSTAELICFIDSDDWVEKDYLSLFIDKHEYRTIVFQGILYDYEEEPSRNEPFFKYDDISFDVKDDKNIVKYNILENGCPYGKIYEKEIINKYKIRFHKDISTHEDHLFVWQYIQHIKRIKLSRKVSYHYMKRGLETLSSKFHPSEEYIMVADLLYIELERIKRLYGLNNTCEYVNKISSSYIIDQYFLAIYNCSYKNYKDIINHVSLKLDIIQRVYISKYMIYKVIYLLLKIKTPRFILYTLVQFFRLLLKLKSNL